jgi:hypothetical protein
MEPSFVRRKKREFVLKLPLRDYQRVCMDFTFIGQEIFGEKDVWVHATTIIRGRLPSTVVLQEPQPSGTRAILEISLARRNRLSIS